ncbi:HAD family hydrolase [Oceanobacillus saliphilus]|uniref:HAD family hydrolase n=1 Tax=Oceanobacillus saliphilus TaxID=2925834 RepID=UPI00201E1A77|nr:HAD family hydrolase [Oceanobacillus saliphilus]
MIKGVLFDKDGTLVEFNSLWVNSTYTMIHSIVSKYMKKDIEETSQKIATAVGLTGNQVKEDSILAGKTSEDLAHVIANMLGADKNAIHEQVNQFYYQSVVENSDEIQAICDLPSLFKKLKKNGLKVGIVTADNADVTEYTIQKLGIERYVDFMGTADLYDKKPGAEAMEVFCKKFNLQSDEIIHIGDTSVDMEFSKHGLFGIGVLSGVSSEETLKQYTPYVIDSVAELIDTNGRFRIPGFPQLQQ